MGQDRIATAIAAAREYLRANPAGAAPDALREIIAWGVAHCPVDDAVRRAVPVEVRVEIG